MKKTAYISHPYGGKLENSLEVEVIIRKLYHVDEIYNNYCLVSPIHAFAFMYTDFDYAKGLSFCTDLMEHCDEVWVFGDWQTSTGCKEEVALANKLGIPVKFLGNIDNLDKVIKFKLWKRIPSSGTSKVPSTPSKKLSTTSAIKAYACISQENYKKYVLGNTDSLKHIILYEDMQMALSKIHNKNKAYAMIEVELSTKNLFDLTSNYNASKFLGFVTDTLCKGTPVFSEKIALRAFIENNKDNIKLIKRTVTSKSPIFIKGVISNKNKVVYKILDTSCIINCTVYNNYVLDSSGRVIVCGKVF